MMPFSLMNTASRAASDSARKRRSLSRNARASRSSSLIRREAIQALGRRQAGGGAAGPAIVPASSRDAACLLWFSPMEDSPSRPEVLAPAGDPLALEAAIGA